MSGCRPELVGSNDRDGLGHPVPTDSSTVGVSQHEPRTSSHRAVFDVF